MSNNKKLTRTKSVQTNKTPRLTPKEKNQIKSELERRVQKNRSIFFS